MTIKSSSSRLFLQPYRLSALQRAALIPYLGAASLLVPERGDYVAGFADLTAGPMLRILVKRISTTVEGRNLLKNKPLISEVSLNMPRLRDLPSDTLGHQYARYMDQYEFSANERSKVRFMMNAEEAYVMTRYRQVHDFWHVLSGLPPTVMGELALKFLEFRVTGLPMCGLAGFLAGPLSGRLTPYQVQSLYTVYIPWAWRTASGGSGSGIGTDAGRDSVRLLTFPYEEHLEATVEEVRGKLNFIPAPVLQVGL